MAQPKVFVSHSHVDDAFAERLVKDLRTAGADAWLDKTDLGAGDFQQRISEALGDCEWFVLVLTKSALMSKWVVQEVNAANSLKHQGRIRDLVFIKAGPVEHRDLPALWSVYNVFDATNDYEMALAKTLAAIGMLSKGMKESDRPASFLSDVAPPIRFNVSLPFRFDASRNVVRVNGDLVRLTPSESRILQLLANHLGETCTLEQIVEHAWGYHEEGDTYLVRAHIRHLREKIEPVPNSPRYIIDVPGGYVLRSPDTKRDTD